MLDQIAISIVASAKKSNVSSKRRAQRLAYRRTEKVRISESLDKGDTDDDSGGGTIRGNTVSQDRP
jgi:hypothetical protein